MVTIKLEYEGQLHCMALHEPSGTVLTTDAPVDNQGRGESFSPTDLVATALGSCVLTVLGILAQTLQLDISGTRATVQKEMASVAPRRIARLMVTIYVPHEFSEDVRAKFERAAVTCPVHRSLHPDVAMPMSFEWGSGSAHQAEAPESRYFSKST